MAGVRIRHKTMRSVLLAVRDLSSRIDAPYPGCGRCLIPSPGHEGYKTRHFDLDSEGATIVSTTIFDRLHSLEDHGGFDLSSATTVASPPAQGLSFKSDGSISVTTERARPFLITTTKE